MTDRSIIRAGVLAICGIRFYCAHALAVGNHVRELEMRERMILSEETNNELHHLQMFYGGQVSPPPCDIDDCKSRAVSFWADKANKGYALCSAHKMEPPHILEEREKIAARSVKKS